MAKAKDNDVPVEEAPKEEKAKVAKPQTEQHPKLVVPEVKDKQHVKIPNFREAVHQKPLKTIEEEYNIGPRDPYPIGNPPSPDELFFEIHGFPPSKASE